MISVKAIFQKILSEILTVADSFKKIMGKILNETFNITAAITRTIKRDFKEALNIADTIIKKFTTQKIFSETVAVAASVKLIPSKILSEVINVTAVFSRIVDFIKNLSETLKIKEALSKIQKIPYVLKVLVQFLTAKKDIELKDADQGIELRGSKKDIDL